MLFFTNLWASMISAYRKFKWFFPVVAIFFALAMAGTTAAKKAAPKNQCVVCHTSGAKLIKLTRDLHKNDPKAESLSEGPG